MLLSFDVGIRTLSFSIFLMDSEYRPVYGATIDLGNKRTYLSRLLVLLRTIYKQFPYTMVVIEQQIHGTINKRIQYFIADYCIVNNIAHCLRKPISYQKAIPERKNRKQYAIFLYENVLAYYNITPVYRLASRPDVADSGVIGIKYLLNNQHLCSGRAPASIVDMFMV